jgi:2-isopropylmalate synthase
MIDLIRDTISAGRMVIWEEVARDGAQAETLLTGPQRVKIGRAMAAMFGEHGPQHLVFAAGYPSIGKEEYEAIRQVVAEVDGCSLATHGRLTRGYGALRTGPFRGHADRCGAGCSGAG